MVRGDAEEKGGGAVQKMEEPGCLPGYYYSP